MPSELKWFDDTKTIAYQQIYGRWTIHEVLQAMVDAREHMLDEHTPIPTYFIVDFREAEGVPSGILAKQPQFTEITRQDSFTVAVGAHDIIRLFIESMQRLGFNRQIVFAATVDEALEKINAHRAEHEEV